MKDLLIVGFGLAGLSIAKHAEDRGLSFNIISDNSQKSSKVAGGLLNPIAVKRMKPVWKVEEFLPYAVEYYKSLESNFKSKFYYKKNIKTIIHNIEQENNWYESYDKPRVQPHVLKDIKTNHSDFITVKYFGIIKGAIVNLNDLFKVAFHYYRITNSWITDTFNYSSLILFNNHVEYKTKSYKHIIFCEGYGVSNNPFFNDLGIYGNKGDYLIIESKKLKLDDIIKSKYFLIPLGDNLYKFGATYQRNPLNHNPSEDAKLQMIDALDKMLCTPYKVINQVCGIRPTTKDRKPILGTHKTHKRLHILNGFGSRGVMTSPLLGKNLLSHIFDGTPLDKEISIQRIYAQI